MYGALAGSMALIVLYAVTQKGASDRIGAAGGIAATIARRLISPQFAGIPQRAALTKQANQGK